jgi:hypothetical protein
MADNTEKVIAYVGPQVSSKGARCVHLYPEMAKGARFRCATVYEERFDELPYGIGKQLMTDEIIPGSAPEMEPAKSQGILQYCAPFHIEIELKPDGVSKTKNLVRVIGPVTASVDAGSVPAGRAFEQALEGLEFHELDKVTVTDQVSSIGTETYWKMSEAIAMFYVAAETLSIPEHLHETVFLAIWRDINDQYRVVRPALLRPCEHEVSYMDGNQIFIGERADFLKDVADQHPNIEDATEAKVICAKLDIAGSSEESAERVEQATQVWLYATLVGKPFNIPPDDAASYVLAAMPLDDLPF